MEIIKVLTNSSALVKDKGQEFIVMGKGLSFGKRPGDQVELYKVRKKYFANLNFSNEKFKSLFEKISYKDSILAFDIIEHFKKELNYPLNDMIYLSLTDHISFAIERARNGIYIPNEVMHEVQLFYPEEFQLAQWATAEINRAAKTNLRDDEAAYIALHIINARWDTDQSKTEQDYGKIINDMITLLSELYDRRFQDQGIDYHRLVTHLKYFLLREFELPTKRTTDFDYYDHIIKNYPEAYQGAEKLYEYMATFFHRKITKEEKVYLTIHINRILQT